MELFCNVTQNCGLKCKGSVIALDKSASKIKQIQENSAKLGLTNIKAFVQDSTTACIMEKPEHLHEYDTTAAVASLPTSPPFLPNSFDRILLDAPCSALGQRPQLYNPIRLKEVQSFARFIYFSIVFFFFSFLLYIFSKDCRKSSFLR